MTARLAFRAAFLTLLAATVAGRIWVVLAPPVSMLAVVDAVLTHEGYRSHLRTEGADHQPFAVAVEAPGCSGPVTVRTIDLDYWEGAWVQEVLEPDASRRFVYMDGVWPTVSRVRLRLKRLRHKLLALLGVSPYVTAVPPLLVLEPSGCHVADAIDWRMIWDRHTLSKAGLLARLE
jgi:hypothetical protein